MSMLGGVWQDRRRALPLGSNVRESKDRISSRKRLLSSDASEHSSRSFHEAHAQGCNSKDMLEFSATMTKVGHDTLVVMNSRDESAHAVRKFEICMLFIRLPC